MSTSKLPALWFSLAAAATGPSAAQDDVTRDPFRIEPLLLDSENGNEVSLGLAFDFAGKFGQVEDDEEDPEESPVPNPDVVLGGRLFTYEVNGTITQDGADNPENLIEANLAAKYFRSSAALSIRAGGFVEYEAEQDLDDAHLLYGGTVTLAKLGVFGDNNFFALDANIGRIEPKGDVEREAVLGPNLEGYTRADVEVLYMINLGEASDGVFDAFEINYRYFHEVSADAAVEAAGLDRYKYAAYRLSFGNNLFVAYATGKLPFDRTSDQIVKIGFTYDLKE
jgi:hypothetical protein